MVDDADARWLRIPPQQLSSQALEGVLEEFISRQGTDYGLYEIPFVEQLQKARSAIDTGEVVIVFDQQLGCCQLLGIDEYNLLQKEAQDV